MLGCKLWRRPKQIETGPELTRFKYYWRWELDAWSVGASTQVYVTYAPTVSRSAKRAPQAQHLQRALLKSTNGPRLRGCRPVPC